MFTFKAVIASQERNFVLVKYDETYFFFNRFETSKDLAIIQDFSAHCAMQNENLLDH
jgi:ABC-type uncharacterized transport system substrate-binding protein